MFIIKSEAECTAQGEGVDVLFDCQAQNRDTAAQPHADEDPHPGLPTRTQCSTNA